MPGRGFGCPLRFGSLVLSVWSTGTPKTAFPNSTPLRPTSGREYKDAEHQYDCSVKTPKGGWNREGVLRRVNEYECQGSAVSVVATSRESRPQDVDHSCPI